VADKKAHDDLASDSARRIRYWPLFELLLPYLTGLFPHFLFPQPEDQRRPPPPP